MFGSVLSWGPTRKDSWRCNDAQKGDRATSLIWEARRPQSRSVCLRCRARAHATDPEKTQTKKKPMTRSRAQRRSDHACETEQKAVCLIHAHEAAHAL